MQAEVTSAIDPRTIEEQLKRILESAHFAETTRMKRFLSHIVTEALAGRSEGLKGYALGIDVFDKPEDFDPTVDTIVRVQANKLRSRLDLYYGQEGRDDPVRIHIPKGSYAPVFQIPFDPAEAVPDISASETTQTDPRTALAVMPFDNLSGDPAQEYLADGVTEELIGSLARFREVRVLSRHVTYRYRARERDPREVGVALGVRYLVEGSVRHWDKNLRITAQLIDAQSGEQMLSEVYDRDLNAESLFEVQDDVAAQIAAVIAEPHGVLHRTGSIRRKAGTHSLDAYQCRLLATEYWREPSEERHAEVRESLERAVKIDPNYSGAWGMLAIIYGDELRGGYNLREDPPPFARALAAAERSVALDPLNATGLHALFLTRYHLGDFDGFEAAAKQALRANPNYPDMLVDLSVCRTIRGDLEEGRNLLMRATRLSPDPPSWYHAGSFILAFSSGDYETALGAARRMDAGVWNGSLLFELMCLGKLGRIDEAAPKLEKLKEAVPDIEGTLDAVLTIWQAPSALAAQMRAGLTEVRALVKP